MGLLNDAGSNKKPPSALEATKYLPSLHNTVWDKSSEIQDIPVDEQVELPKNLQLSVRRKPN